MVLTNRVGQRYIYICIVLWVVGQQTHKKVIPNQKVDERRLERDYQRVLGVTMCETKGSYDIVYSAI